MNFKDIHIGQIIKAKVAESGIEVSRLCNFMKAEEDEIEVFYQSPEMNTEVLLKWCKLLEYDFFRLYSQHLLLYAPPSAVENKNPAVPKSKLPLFRKKLYTREIIDFILEQIAGGEMTKTEVIERYRIPKTTLYKWISKYGK